MRPLLILVSCLSLWSCQSQPETSPTIWLSVVGTNDVHGELDSERGGLSAFSGYVAALRARRHDDGAVLLLDAGDMWQGTLESNLSEGAAVVSVYNALRYDAAAIGNHEFDFGPVGDAPIPVEPGDDPRGALRARASEATFPLLAANLIDKRTGRPVDWDNVAPSILIDRGPVRIGVIGVTTEDTLATTIVANTVDLQLAPLTTTIEYEARSLRARGADLIVVVAHAGGSCAETDNPLDLSSCNPDAEIFRVARTLPRGLVNQIVAGHRHRPLAHVVNDIAITSNGSGVRSFGRVDYQWDVAAKRILQRVVFPPQRVCRHVIEGQDRCAQDDEKDAVAARYEGIAIQSDRQIRTVVRDALARADSIKREPLGVIIDEAITRSNPPFSAIGRLLTDALRESTNSDVAIHNVVGGIRDDLPAGPLTFGDVYRAFPFDNRMAQLRLSGRQLKTLLANQVPNLARRAGVSGLTVVVACDGGNMSLELHRPNGRIVNNDDVLSVVANDFLLLGGDNIFTPIEPAGGFALDPTQPLLRDMWADWFRNRGGRVSQSDYTTPSQQRWQLPDPLPTECLWRGS